MWSQLGKIATNLMFNFLDILRNGDEHALKMSLNDFVVTGQIGKIVWQHEVVELAQDVGLSRQWDEDEGNVGSITAIKHKKNL